MSGLKETADFLENTWFEKRGLFASIIVTSVLVLPTIHNAYGLAWALTSTIFIDIFVLTIWLLCQSPARTPKNKIGFLICISTSDDDEAKKLYEDFIHPLQALIKEGRTGNFFSVLIMPQHIARSIQDVEQAEALRIKCHAHFMVFGHARVRNINGQDTHVLDLEGFVAHRPIPDAIANNLQQEFSELMPRKLRLSKENDLLTFQFTSEWTNVVSQYIIGIVLSLSGDWDRAELLFLQAKRNLLNKNTKFPIYTKLKERIPDRISDIFMARADFAFKRWASTRQTDALIDAEQIMRNLSAQHKESPHALYLSAICQFALHENVIGAIDLIKKIKDRDQAIWHLNIAFLLAYQGQLRNALRHYRLSLSYEIEPDTIAQVEDFIIWVLEHHPEKYQLHYCLGFFNWKIKGDPLQAKIDFDHFLSNGDTLEFKIERDLANKWIEEINKKEAVEAAA